jgi:hypothetical protein
MATYKYKLKKALNERGVNLENFPDTYLAQRRRDVVAYNEVKNKVKELVTEFSNISWKDLSWNVTSNNYAYPILPNNLISRINELIATNRTAAYDRIGKWYGTNGVTVSDAIHFTVEREGHRSHFPTGIPVALRGTSNMGQKMYRSLLERFKYLRSQTNGTVEKDRVWSNIVSSKVDAAGLPTDEDVHAIVATSNVFAMIKSIPPAEKIRLAKNFIDTRLTKADITETNFGMDDELKSLFQDRDPDYLLSLDPRRAAERVEIAMRDRLAKFAPGGANDHSWDVGDLVVLKDYLLQDYNPLPVRMVVKKTNDVYTAIKVSDVPTYIRSGSLQDTRTTSNKQIWTKSHIGPLTHTEKEIVNSTIRSGDTVVLGNRGTATTTATGTTAPTTATTTATTANDLFTFSDTARSKRIYENFKRINRNSLYYVEDRSVRAVTTTRGTVIYSMMNNEAAAAFTGGGDIDIDILLNIRLGITSAFSSPSRPPLRKIELTPLAAKTDVRPGDLVFVKEHRTYFGFIATVEYITRTRGEERVYVRFKRNSRPIEMRVTALSKVTVGDGLTTV